MTHEWLWMVSIKIKIVKYNYYNYNLVELLPYNIDWFIYGL